MTPDVRDKEPAASPTVRPIRMVVADIAYDDVVVAGREPCSVKALVRGINGSSVAVDGVRISTAAAWSEVFARALEGLGAVELAHPTTWGVRRTEILRQAAQPHCGHLVLTPRASVIAESHLGSSTQRALVIEVHSRIDIHEMDRSAGSWTVVGTSVATAETVALRLGDIVDNRVEAILVDGTDPAAVAEVLRCCEVHTVVGRVAAVQRSLIHRFGGAALPVDEGIREPPTDGRTPVRRRVAGAVAATAAVVIAVVVIALMVDNGRAGVPPPADREAQLGRVAVTVPVEWRESSEPAAEGVVSRTTFAAPGDDRRIIVLQNTVRNTSTLASVAGSLRNRIGQRGDDVVQEFSASTRYAGREVISYREVPVSGGPIRWYLLVSAGLQVSVGCQGGSAGETIDEQCRVAVGAVRIGAP
ncbi:type VII secretion-associated protein (TIGR03931 family) [Williamsia muralis]|uniref:Type VII secretion-associated protein (TIGR03931 family) n=1 Tax=Williamsia marianensis TaxID=85044 RepID=A0A495K4L8_WILMA|nr:type VII secretion-associated protein (TIGR03931 family) [Williamsia muralis]